MSSVDHDGGKPASSTQTDPWLCPALIRSLDPSLELPSANHSGPEPEGHWWRCGGRRSDMSWVEEEKEHIRKSLKSCFYPAWAFLTHKSVSEHSPEPPSSEWVSVVL